MQRGVSDRSPMRIMSNPFFRSPMRNKPNEVGSGIDFIVYNPAKVRETFV